MQDFTFKNMSGGSKVITRGRAVIDRKTGDC